MDWPSIVLNVIAGLFLLVQAMSWYLVTRLYGKVPIAESITTFRASLGTRQAFIMIAGFGMLVTILINMLFPDALPPFPPFLLLALLLLAVGSILQPPSIIFLGRSDPESVALYTSIAMNIRPHRAIHLLDASRLGAVDRQMVNPGGIRQDPLFAPSASWVDVVHRILMLVPYIVVDARRLTGPIRLELELIMENDLSSKTVFVTDPGVVSPVARQWHVLTLARRGLPPRVRSTTTEGAPTLVRSLVFARSAPVQ